MIPRWLKHLLDKCPPNSFKSMPEESKKQSAQWRFADYNAFRYDVVECYGPVAAVSLSLTYKPKVIVEMGVFSGHTSFILCRSNPTAEVHGVDIREIMAGTNLPVGYTANLHGVDNLTIHKGNSYEFKMPGKVDLCFIDADHIGDAPYKDSLQAWENRNTSGDWCIAWDDYHINNPDIVSAVDRFVKEKGFELHNLMSWVYIGTKPHKDVEYFLLADEDKVMEQISPTGDKITIIHFAYAMGNNYRLACMPNMTELGETKYHRHYQHTNATQATTCPQCISTTIYKIHKESNRVG